ncbi:MAG TPA: hypothetical protein VFW21_15875 [Mycobacterium sp.]|nr:hypothetical protein [Mycobacterium sp.]
MGGPWTPRTPDWVTPPASHIADEHWLAYAMLVRDRLPWAAGVACSIAWIRGGRVGPITERDEQPVTRAVADAERWAAEAARVPANPPPMDVIYAQLKVTPWAPLPNQDPNYAVGCWRALRWVLGVPGQDPPIPVPRRRPDGSLYTAEELYAEVIRADDGRLSPEQRATKRVQAECDAAKYWHYAEQIAQVQRDLGWDHAGAS